MNDFATWKTKETVKAWVGVDPGKTGAAVRISDIGIDFFDFEDVYQAAKKIGYWNSAYHLNVILEKVHAFPGQGVTSVFNFGMNYGSWQGIFAAYRIPVTLVTPQKWRKEFIIKSEGHDTKSRSLAAARRLFPKIEWLSRKKDHDRADALLMAYYGRLNG